MDSSTSQMKSSPTDFAATMAPSTAHTADFGRSMEVSNHESSNQQEQQQPLQVPPPLVLPPAIPPQQQQQQGGTVDSATATAMIMAGGPAGMEPDPFLFVDYNHNNVYLGPPCRVFESYYPGESSGHLYTEGLHQRGFPELFAQDVPRHRASLVIKNMYFLAQRMVSGIAVQGGHRSTDHDYRVVLVDMIEYRQHILMECMHGSSLPPHVQASMRILALHSLYEDAEEWGSFPPAPGGQRQRRNKILAAALFQKQQQITFDEDDIAYLLCNMGHFCRLVEVPQALDVIQRLPPALAEPVYRQYCLNILGCASQQASPPAVAATAAEDQQEDKAASTPSPRRGSATSAASVTNKTSKTKPKTANRRPRKPLKQVQPSSSKADCTPKKEGHKSPIKKRKPTKKTPTKNVVRLLTASPAKKEERSYSKQQLVLGSPKVVSKTVHSKNQNDTNALDDATVATTSTSSQQETIQGDKDPLPSSSSGAGKNLTTTSSSSPSSSGLASPAGGKEFSELYLRMKQEHAASNGTLLMGSPSLVHNMATSTSSATPIVSNKQTAV